MSEHLYIVCHLGEKIIAVPGEQIVEVIPACAITPLPITIPYVKGLIQHNGKAVCILDETLPFFGKSRDALKYFIILSLENDEIGIGAHRIDREIAVHDHTWVHHPEDAFEFSCNIKGHVIYRLDIKAWGGDGVGQDKG